MFPKSWRRWWVGFEASGRPHAGRRASRFLPVLDFLEDRTVPSTFSPSVFTDSTAAGVNSLRNAIIAANADPGAGADTITLKAGTYRLTLKNTNGQENQAVTGDLDITSTAHTLIIQGQGMTGPKKTVIDASTLQDRVFQIVNAGTGLELRDLVIEGGLARDDGSSGAKPGDFDALGGGILNNGGTLRLDHVLLTGNRAVGAGGGNGAPGKGSNPTGGDGGNGGNAHGGGLFTSDGTVTLTHAIISGNSALGGKGGSGGAGGKMMGGSISGGPVPGGAGGAGGDAQGGGLFADAGLVTLTGTTVSANTAVGGNAGNNARGAGSTATSAAVNTGGNAAGGGLFDAGATLSLTASTVAGNTARAGQGGSSSNSVGAAGARGGSANGGGIFAGGDTSLSNTTIAGNIAQGAGGGNAGPGGALSGPTGSGSVIPGGKGGAGGDAQGGGLFAAGGTVTLTNATLALNAVKAGAGGAGGKGQHPGPHGNAGNALGGGAAADPAATVNLQNTLIAENTAKSAPDYSGAAAATDHDLIGDGTGSSGFNSANGDQVGTAASPINPLLASLRNHGGPTLTLALLPGSPAIDMGDNNASPGATDQRGLTRIANGTIDIGAVEYQADLAVSIKATAASVKAGGTITYKLTVTNRGPDPAGAIALTDVLPSNTTFVSLSVPRHWTKGVPAVGASGTVTATASAGAALPAGASAAFTLVVRVTGLTGSGTDISNTATLAFAWDSDSSNNSATKIVRVR